ncbi:nucleotide-diphospho-sugar transferase [Pavlovales sp. CCMP2436]|nr:nucleotide-diphospho-sugar transferase [Pavlovales sp. CCMP2436]
MPPPPYPPNRRDGTILVTKVEEPSKYGVVVYDADGKVKRFVYKPKQRGFTVSVKKNYAGNFVSAGVSVYNASVLDRLSPKPTSMEKEILPVMAQEEQLYCMPLNSSYWLDIGFPKHHLLGAELRLAHLRATDPSQLSTHSSVIGDVLMHSSAKIGEGCEIGPGVVIGPNVTVHDGTTFKRVQLPFFGINVCHGAGRREAGASGARCSRGVKLERCTLLEGCTIGKHSLVIDSIIGWQVL